ncbi:Rossmann-like and DUF2520 domain-containing protein [Gracilimonas mengyeensis]|uniref:Predicted oxidoreductase, contains short-chain dehydrogenase (SDR) and DUF2520 domains n=1 Tax=Gracilimonas mengyeensis TaxID=1302730 RepID=A0A521ARW1_9BACT|nr:Rossmann-like and DUF2520 domain-containing protein [Gracilimonas mengyeensis]SMO37557.1 Predicted oxidoreductase, contains short-chain dehydrogenase (SDR) and DUF2520 domains [Gracilimonas mengyeensis]
MKNTTVSIIGLGRVGTAFLRVLSEHGYEVTSVFNRSEIDEDLSRQFPETTFYTGLPTRDDQTGNLLIISVTDDAIEGVVEHLKKEYKSLEELQVVHCSGTHTSNILKPLKEKGAAIASFHPIKSITPETKDFSGTWFDIEGDEELEDDLSLICNDIGAQSFTVSPDTKPLLHISAVVASNYLVVLAGLASQISSKEVSEEVLLKALTPLMRNTLDNINELGTEKALTGPVVRGDVETIKEHLDLLKSSPEVRDLYKMLGAEALNISRRANGETPEYDKIEEMLS